MAGNIFRKNTFGPRRLRGHGLTKTQTLSVSTFSRVSLAILQSLKFKQEKMSAPSTDMICGRRSVAERGVDSKLGLTMVRPSLQSAPELPALDPPPVSKLTCPPDMRQFLEVFGVRSGPKNLTVR